MIPVLIVALVLVVVAAMLVLERVVSNRAAARALNAAADDYSVNLGTWTPWQVRQWLRDRARCPRGHCDHRDCRLWRGGVR